MGKRGFRKLLVMSSAGQKVGAVFAALLLSATFAGQAQAQDACRDDSIWLRGDWGTARFSVEVADTKAERSQGLMHRREMPMSAGMIFIYDRTGPASFWMRNTLIPLDMLFADETGVVQHVHSNAIPLDETPIFGGNAVRYVLEINGGLAKSLGITVGSEMRHPALSQEFANWPC